jgi:hypothetical protein
MDAVWVTKDDAKMKGRRERWRFVYMPQEHMLVLDSYVVEVRVPKTQKWYREKMYSRILGYDLQGIRETEVLIPAEVMTEARSLFVAGLRVGKWGGRYSKGTPSTHRPLAREN